MARLHLTQSHLLFVAPLHEHEGGQVLTLEPHDDSRDIGALAVADFLSLAIGHLPADVQVEVHPWVRSATPLYREVELGRWMPGKKRKKRQQD